MFRFNRRRLMWLAVFVNVSSAALAQNVPVTAEDLTHAISKKYNGAKQYSFQGDLEIAQRRGSEAPKEVLIKAKIRFNALSDKYLLEIEDLDDKSRYLVVSDGRKIWEYAASANQYTQRESAEFARPGSDRGANFKAPDGRAMAAEFCSEAVPILAGLAGTADMMFLKGSLLTVLSKKDERGHQNLTYIALDTATLQLQRLSWMNAAPMQDGDKELMRSDLSFQTFQLGGANTEADFTFHPPQGAVRVQSLPDSANPANH